MPLPPLTRPVVPIGRPAAASHDPRRRWALIGSALLHLLAVLALLVSPRPEQPMPVAPSYDLIFENGGSSTPPTSSEHAMDNSPPTAPAADLPPAPPAEPPAPPSPEPATPPQPSASPPQQLAEPEPEAEPAPAPAPQEQPPPAAAPSVSTPAPSPEPPAVRLAEPDAAPPPVSPQTLAPDLPELAPPPPVPPEQPQPRPRAPRPRAQAQQRPAPGAFPPPIDLNYGPAASRAPSPRVARSSRAIDLSLGTPKLGPNKDEAFFKIRAANIGADWAQSLAAYWRQHRYYPEQAAQNGEDGTVEIQIVVNRLGRVESVEIQRRSGSPWLDMAAVGTWRNAQLPPLPRENTDPTITIPLTINYVLLR